MADYTCDDVIDILTQEAGRFGPTIYDRTFQSSPLVGLVKRSTFPAGMGTVLSNLTYERTVPLSVEPTWSTITVDETADGAAGGSCLPPVTKVGIGSTVRTYQLKRRALEGPDICAVDLLYKFSLRQQLEKILSILGEYSATEWEIRYRHDFFTTVGNKTVVNGNYKTTATGTGADYPAQCPTSILTQGVLNWAKGKLLRNGAIRSALGRDSGQAVLTLITSPETSDRLIFENADIRQDLRYGKPSELLAGYGVDRSYRGFYHLLDNYNRHFTCADGVDTEIAAFDTAAATKGNKAIMNSAWETATDEESTIFDPTVMESLIPEPVTNPAPGFKFDPVSYLGDWRLMNILDRVCNPDGNIVYHRGILAHAAMPVHPERGWAFQHLRCDPSPNFVTDCGS